MIAWTNAVSWATTIAAHSGRPRSAGQRWAASAHSAGDGVGDDQHPGTDACQSSVALAITSADQRVGFVAALDQAEPVAGVVVDDGDRALSRLRITTRSSPRQAPITALMATKWDTTTVSAAQRGDVGDDTRRGTRRSVAELGPRAGHRPPQPLDAIAHRHARRRRDLGDRGLDRPASTPQRRASGAAVSGTAAAGW